MVEPLPRIRPSGLIAPLDNLRRLSIPRPLQTIWHSYLGPIHTASPVFTYHALYFFVLNLLGSIVLFSLGTLSYLDSLFLSITSCTGAGLGNVALSDVTLGMQVMVALLIVTGGQVWVAACAVGVQKWRMGWEIEREKIAKAAAEARREDQKVQEPVSPKEEVSAIPASPAPGSPGDKLIGECVKPPPRRTSISIRPYDPDLDLTPSNRYAALSLLFWILLLYLLIFHLVGTLLLGFYLASAAGRDILASDGHGLNPWWWAVFNTLSSFANSGMSLLDANMAPFATRGSIVVLAQTALILVGNSAFPLVLRSVLWTMEFANVRAGDVGRKVLMGKHGKAVLPYLVDRRERWWLAAMMTALNGIDWAAYAATFRFTSISLSPASIALTGLFQAVSVRSGGFAIVPIAQLHTTLLLLYIIMMYLSAFPMSPKPPFPPPMSPTNPLSLTLSYSHSHAHSYRRSTGTLSFIRHQFRGLMRAGDLRYLMTAVWLITAVQGLEARHILGTLFEVASAYGCVGVSMGDDRTPEQGGDGRLAMVGGWKGGAKGVLAAVMMLGRLREVRRGILWEWGVDEGWAEGVGENEVEV